MLQRESLRVLDETVAETAGAEAASVEEIDVASFYDGADPGFDPAEYDPSWDFPRFINAVRRETGRDDSANEARAVDDLPGDDDIDFGVLLAFPDESLMFVGSDPTAKDTQPWFAFTIGPTEPIPAPSTAQDALDLLKPPRVRSFVEDDGWLPTRHGEWWLLPCALVPAGTVFVPGVQSRPYGPSPLGNHVPREYAFTVSDGEFMRRFRDAVPEAPASLETPPEVIEWTCRQLAKAYTPDWVPRWPDIRAYAGDIIVRGTVRHRDDDHYVENLGDDWHLADTHDVEVYTADDVGRVHVDYYGREE